MIRIGRMLPALCFFLAWCLCTPTAKAFYSCSPQLAKQLPQVCKSAYGHYQITFLGATGFGFSPSALTRIAGANINVDLQEVFVFYNGAYFILSPLPFVYKATDHFDHDPDIPITTVGMTTDQQAFLNARAEVLKKRADIISILTAGDCSRIGQALDELGQALHAVQDLYSHSNYADPTFPPNIGLDSTGRDLLNKALLDPSMQPPVGLKLTLYKFSLTEPEDPTGTCNGSDPSVYCHEFWAKDSPGKNPISGSISNDYSIFNAAVSAAGHATAAFIQSIVNQVTPAQWKVFTDYGTPASVCPPPQPPCSNTFNRGCHPQIFSGSVITPGDPNDKAGSQGFGSQQYISGLTPLRYAIQYGNEADASAPAARVVITDPLDVAHMDLTTFLLGPIAFAGQIITPPPIPGDFSSTVDLRPGNNLLVSVQTHLDRATGILTYTFQSLDPKTNKPPTDPTAGFLAPGATGSILFTAMTKAGTSTGTQVSNQATVIFDALPSIPTPSWSNAIDNTAPVSHVVALSAATSNLTFPVTWSGTDLGSGVESYSVYVSDNGGVYTLWPTDGAITSATYTGQTGHTYGFYSIATDGAGNVEAPKSGPDATIQIVPPATTTMLQASSNSATAGQAVTLTGTVAGPASSAVAPTGMITYYSGTSILGTATLNSNAVATFVTALPVGVDSIIAQYSGDANFASSISSKISVTVAMIATATTVTSSGTPANLGASVTFTVRVAGPAGSLIPTGTITLNDGTAALGAATLDGTGAATYSSATLAAATHPITAVYSGDGNFFGSTSGVLNQVINAPAFSVSASPAALTITGGQSGQTTLTVIPVGGLKSQISFACSGLPAYATCTFAPTTVAADGANTPVTSTLTIATNVKSASVSNPATPHGPGRQGETYLALTLFGMAGLFGTRRKVGKSNRLLRSVFLSCSLLSIAAAGMLACSGQNQTTPRGTDTITITASSGSSTSTASFVLTIQ